MFFVFSNFGGCRFFQVWVILKIQLFLNSFLSLASMWEFRMKSFSASVEVLWPPLVGSPLTMSSLLMGSSLTKSLGIVKNLFLLRLAPRTKIFKSGNAWSFAIEYSSDDWIHIREVKDHCELANVIWSFSLYVVILDDNEETFWM